MTMGEPVQPVCTVAVCTRNRRDSLLLTLDSLARQHRADRWELLVVDNGSDDGTAEAATARAAALGLSGFRIEHEPRAGVSRARNRALETARGEYVVFVDDDVTCDPGFVAAYGAAFETERPAGAGGRIVPLVPEHFPPWLRDVLAARQGGPTSRYDFGERPAEIVHGGPIPVPFGANMAVARESAQRAGGFREDLGWGPRMLPGEETELFVRLRAAGGRLLYVPGARVLHRVGPERLEPEAIVRWHRTYGRAQAVFTREQGRAPDWRWRARELLKAAFYGVAARAAWRPARRLRYRCKRAAAAGRLEQLSWPDPPPAERD
jgi:GT2 family glycosyltransferase